MVSNIESLQSTFEGGWNTDVDLRRVKPNQFIDASDAEFVSSEEGKLSSVETVKSMSLLYEIPAVPVQLLLLRIPFTASVPVVTELFNESNNLIGVDNSLAGYATASDYISGLNTTFGSSGAYPVFTLIGSDGGYLLVSVRQVAPSVYYNYRLLVNNIEAIPVQYANQSVDTLVFLASCTLNGIDFVLSAGTRFSEIGTHKDGVYTRLMRSNKIQFDKTSPIDISVELSNYGTYCVYVSGTPMVFYISDPFTEDSLMKYTTSSFSSGTSGYFVYLHEKKQAGLQLFCNQLSVKLKEQRQFRGNLKSGGYRYAVRGKLISGDVTPFSVLTPNPIPVFEAGTDNRNSGLDVEGKPNVMTNKVNVLTITGIDPFLLDYIELAAVHYSGADQTVASSVIGVGEFKVTGESMDVEHNGYETGSFDVTIEDLSIASDVLTHVNNLQIKKRRINLSNVEVAVDEDLSSVFSNATIETKVYPINQVGDLSLSEVTLVKASTLTEVIPPSAVVNTAVAAGTNVSHTFPFDYVYTGGLNIVPTSPSYGYFTPLVSFTQNVNVDIEYLVGYNNPTGYFPHPYLKIKLQLWKISPGAAHVVWESDNRYIDTNSSLVKDAIGLGLLGATLIGGDKNIRKYQKESFSFEASPGDIFKLCYYVTEQKDAQFFFGGASMSIKGTSNDVYIHCDEYANPLNAANKVGYMVNESYPFFAVATYENGYVSSPYYIGTHKFLPVSDINQDGTLFTGIPKYVPSGLDTNPAVMVYYAKISGIDTAALSANGVTSVQIWRGICNPTVIGSGIFMASDNGKSTGGNYAVGQYASEQDNSHNYGYKYPLGTEFARKLGVFISPDTKRLDQRFSKGNLLVYGAPIKGTMNHVYSNKGKGIGYMAQYYGHTGNRAALDTFQPTTIPITSGIYNQFNNVSEPIRDSSGKIFRYDADTKMSATGSMAGVAMLLSAPVKDLISGSSSYDNGVYIAQYVIELDNQYDLKTVKIVPTGAIMPVSKLQGKSGTSVDVFGGDTYTQRNTLKVCYWANKNNIIDANVSGFAEDYLTSFVSYYAQSRFNTQMKYNNLGDTATYTLSAHKNIYSYLFPFDSQDNIVEEQFNYDSGYSAENIVNQQVAYNKQNIPASKLQARIYYSDPKPEASTVDLYRNIKSLSYRDMDSKNGAIKGIIDQGNYMLCLQPYAVTPLIYSSDAFVSTAIGAIQTTAGDVYPTNEVPISTYGPSSKSAILRGTNQNGNTATYWYSGWSKKLCRYGHDGLAVLSDVFGFRTALESNMSADSSTEYDVVVGWRAKNNQMYVHDKNTGYTFGWNERLNRGTGRYNFTMPRTASSNQKLLIASASTGKVYEFAGGADYLDYKEFGAGTFSITPVFNKYADLTKRAFAYALSIGEDAMDAPEILFQSEDVFANKADITHRRGLFVGSVGLYNDQRAIEGQYVTATISSSKYFRMLSAYLKVRLKHRLI